MSGEKNSFDNFEELYTNCYWLVYRYVRHMIEKDLAAAEDVTQEVSGCISEMAGGAQTSESERFFAADS